MCAGVYGDPCAGRELRGAISDAWDGVYSPDLPYSMVNSSVEA